MSLLSSFGLSAQQAINTDIFIGKLNLRDKQAITNIVRLTDNDHYTNQPYFFDNSNLYYTQMIELDGIEQTDVMHFNLKTGELKNVTQSLESEYSPTPMLGKRAMSVIRVDANGLQELWEINAQGIPQKNITPSIEPVGYQVWLSKDEVALFVLGEPHTLQRVTLLEDSESTGIIIDNNIGASLVKFMRSPFMLYSQNIDKNYLKSYHPKQNKSQNIVRLPENSEYFTVTPLGTLLTSDGEKIWYRRFIHKGDRISPFSKWNSIELEHENCGSGISRMAVSPDNTMIAMVCPRTEQTKSDK